MKGVIFDMDNTLFDFVEAKMIACTEVVSFLGAGDPEELFEYFRRETHGFENPENIRDYMLDNGFDPAEKYQKCVTIYETHKINNIKLYPDVRETLEELNEIGLLIGIVTDANSDNARKRLVRTGLEGMIHSLTAHDMTGQKKPDLAPFKYALGTMGLLASETLFVGDSLRRDIMPSKQLGMMAAYAAYGDRNSAMDRTSGDYEPDRTLNNFREVLEIVLEFNENDRI
ncbi:HAD family hydrolase [Methanolobus sediminis]|uniref:HAD family hydrolase n=1 Tax=Methanolobus sediminis TaxID=3072978 RepID=A0AA51ULF0_9EURY|nr:HAD family hydrolase [Methanolobus sediminis]WMW25733.1 HAD family hydrolase [Methanolobus sediminis]